jgi:RNA polymerase sigma-70 factor (ECF subfamily)
MRRLLRDRRHARLLLCGRRGDGEAFRALYRELYPPVWSYLARRLPRPEDAEDLVSEVFHSFLEQLPRYEPRRGSVLSWVLTIAHHSLVDSRRRRRPAVPLDERIESLPRPEPSPLQELLRKEGARRLQALVRELPDQTRDILALRFGGELRYREIARLLGLSEAAVRQRVSRAVRSLEAELWSAGNGQPEQNRETDHVC